MADVFEKEGSPTQDAAYREHLDRNWEAGNKKFAELEKKFKDSEDKYQDVIVGQDSNDVAIKDKEAQIKALELQVAKLTLAVFGDGAVPIDTQIHSINQINKAQEVHFD